MSRYRSRATGPFFWRISASYIRAIALYHEPLPLRRYYSMITSRLEEAGNSLSLTAPEFLVIKELSGLSAMVMGWIVLSFPGKISIGSSLLSLCTGFFLPDLSLRETLLRRRKAIIKALPHTIDLLTLIVEAGCDLMNGIRVVVEKGSAGPLWEELSQLLQEITMGKTKREALHDLGVRANIPAVKSLVGAVIQAETLGTPLARVLRIQSEQRRAERFQRAEKLAQEAPVKLLFPLLFFIFPCIFIVVLGPIILKFIHEGAF